MPDGEAHVRVTPLMVACYLGDDQAANAIVGLAEDHWAVAMLTRSHRGDDCLALAREAHDIAEKLCGDAEERRSAAATEEDHEERETTIKWCEANLAMATNLVERIRSLKNFALEKERKGKRCSVVVTIVVGLVGIMCYQYHVKVQSVLRVVWMILRFFLKYGSILFVFYLLPLVLGVGLVAYYLCTREPSSSVS